MPASFFTSAIAETLGDSSMSNVLLGERVWRGTTWSRQDSIYFEGKKVGFIRLTEKNRQGFTTSTVTHKTHVGRAIAWCIDQANTSQQGSGERLAA